MNVLEALWMVGVPVVWTLLVLRKGRDTEAAVGDLRRDESFRRTLAGKLASPAMPARPAAKLEHA